MTYSLVFIFYFPPNPVAAVQGGSAAISRCSPALRRHGQGRSSGEAVRRSCWRVKRQMSRAETENERVPSPGDRASQRKKQNQSAAESGSLVSDTTLVVHGKKLFKYRKISRGATLIPGSYQTSCVSAQYQPSIMTSFLV